MPEIWRAVVGYEGQYEVSDLGRVRGVRRRGTSGGVLAQAPWGKDYLLVQLHNGSYRHRRVHQLVLESFVGPCPEGMEARHLNDVKTDNRLVNLAWGTHAENGADMRRNRLHPYAHKTHCIHGHEYDEANTIWRTDGRGGRRCRACEQRWNREGKARKRVKQ